MMGLGYFLVFASVGVAFIIAAPIFALLGYLIFRHKHLSGRQGALRGAVAPLLGGIIGLLPYFAAVFIRESGPVQDFGINFGLFVPLLSIPIGIIVLVGMQVFVKPQSMA